MQLGPERLIVIEGIPVAHGLLENGHVFTVSRLLDVQHESFGDDEASSLTHDLLECLIGRFVQEHGALNPIKACVLKLIQVRRIRLHKGDIGDTHARSSRRAVAEHRRSCIYSDDLGIRKRLGNR